MFPKLHVKADPHVLIFMHVLNTCLLISLIGDVLKAVGREAGFGNCDHILVKMCKISDH